MHRYLLLLCSYLACAACAWPGTAAAAHWVEIYAFRDGRMIYADLETVGYAPNVPRNIQQIWVKYTFPTPQTTRDGKQFSSFVALFHVDCKAHTITRGDSSTAYTQDGKVVDHWDQQSAFTPIRPDSLGEALFGALCT